MNSETRTCQNCKNNFVIEPDDFGFYERVNVPPPTFCPECRLIRRLAWRNEKSLYRRTCDKCSKSIISVFSKDTGLTVYCPPCWWADDWDGLEYGVDYDPTRPFLIQLRELLQKTPVMGLFGLYTTIENSDYTNMVTGVKNCYLTTHSDYCENCSYGSVMDFCKESMDGLMLAKCELCYETVNCRDCHKTTYSVDCESCHNVAFSKNCVGCSDCIGCVNLRNKKYCIFNKQYSKEEYEKLSKDYLVNSYAHNQELKKKAVEFWNTFPQKYIHGSHNANVSGDYIYNSKNTRDTFIAPDTEDSRFCSFITPSQVSNCYDFTHYGHTADLVYDSLQIGNQASRVSFSWFVVANVQNIAYSMFTIGSKNIFGSVGLKKREYYILNKQYSKEEFEALRARIIADMNKNPYEDAQGNKYLYGEFFPVEMSPFGYNATTAQELFPLTKEEAGQKGYHWKEQEKSEYMITVKSEHVPDSSLAVEDSFAKEVIGCEHAGGCSHQCSTAFRFLSEELAFYKRMNLPLPHLCPNCRHFARLEFRNPFKLWKRQCMCDYSAYENSAKHPHHLETQCPNTFETSYDPGKSDIVYCEQCYQAEIL